MSRAFCTLFDSFYLTRGLSLHASLLKTGEPFHLYIYCFDSLSHEILTRLKLPCVTLVPLEKFETPELLAVKPTRKKGEYCWTCTSHTIHDCMIRHQLPEVTYLDADLYFFDRPGLLLEEFDASRASILITEHRYAPEYDQTATSGKYCVQFMTFKNDARGLKALDWWKARCLEWCFDRLEDGKFGDQKYLDDWLTRFEGVHVLRHPGGGVAPWNVSRYSVTEGPEVDGKPVVFYHFHKFQWREGDRFSLCGGLYSLPEGAIDWIYRPYIDALLAAREKAASVQPGFHGGILPKTQGLKERLREVKQRVKGRHHVL